LAHIVANHCGYRPVELNASDDRSAEALRDVLSRSMGSNTLDDIGIGAFSGEKGESKPNCVILDEIDGVDGRAPIDALIAIIRAPLQSGASSTGKKKKKGTFAITRPVICICNDQYAPMLRELRAEAKVFVFSPPTETRLVQRLKHVCAAEGIQHINPQALSALCQASGSDIRSAINTLQFTALRCGNKLGSAPTQLDISNTFSRTLNRMLISGLKDERQDVFELWRKIFCSKDQNSSNASARLLPGQSTVGGGDVDVNSFRTVRPTHAMDVFESVAGYGDNQLVTMGLFDNYLTVRYTDPTFQRTCTAADWLSFGDLLEGKMYSGEAGSHSTGGYVPAVAGVLHLMCSTDARLQKVAYPIKVLCPVK
jgi:chromosome transmission fidelity protein 18